MNDLIWISQLRENIPRGGFTVAHKHDLASRNSFSYRETLVSSTEVRLIDKHTNHRQKITHKNKAAIHWKYNKSSYDWFLTFPRMWKIWCYVMLRITNHFLSEQGYSKLSIVKICPHSSKKIKNNLFPWVSLTAFFINYKKVTLHFLFNSGA